MLCVDQLCKLKVSPSPTTCCVRADRRERTLAGATVEVHSLLTLVAVTHWQEWSALALVVLGMVSLGCMQRWQSSVGGLTRLSQPGTPVPYSATNYLTRLPSSYKDTGVNFCNQHIV